MATFNFSQKHIEKLIDDKSEGKTPLTRAIGDFIARGVNEEWEVGFTLNGSTNYRLSTRRSLKSARRFKTLTGVQAWMKKMNITTYTVDYS